MYCCGHLAKSQCELLSLDWTHLSSPSMHATFIGAELPLFPHHNRVLVHKCQALRYCCSEIAIEHAENQSRLPLKPVMSPFIKEVCSSQVLILPHGEGFSPLLPAARMCTQWTALNIYAGVPSSLKSVFQFKSISLAKSCIFNRVAVK